MIHSYNNDEMLPDFAIHVEIPPHFANNVIIIILIIIITRAVLGFGGWCMAFWAWVGVLGGWLVGVRSRVSGFVVVGWMF